MEITSTLLGSIQHLLGAGHSLMIKESLAWARCLVILTILTIMELVAAPVGEYCLGYILLKLVILAWYFGPLAYKGLSFMVRLVGRVELV